MDEATSDIDLETSQHVEELIKTEFKKCTVITIGNRLEKIHTYDKIMLLHEGKLIEFDTPKTLMLRKDSKFNLFYDYFK